MSNSSSSLDEGSDAPQVLVPSPDRDNHKIPILYSEEKQVSSSDTEAFARNQPYGPSYYSAVYGHRSYHEEQQHLSLQRPAGSRRICGLRPVWFWTVAVLVVLLLIGATAGGVAGGMMRRQSQTPSPASQSSSAPPAELQDSQLSAVNWTDSTGAQRKAVFHQRNGTLHVSRNGGGDGTAGWAELDIEAQFPEGTVAATNATPLAASVVGGANANLDTSFSAALYFIDATNQIRDLVSTADDLSTWTKGPMWNVSVAASAMSGLAAAAHICSEGCLGDRIVVFQVNSGDLYSVHGPDWSDAPTRIVGANIGTPLALTPAPYVNTSSGAVEWTAEQTQLRLYYHRDASIDEFFFNDEEPLDWNPGEKQRDPLSAALTLVHPAFPLSSIITTTEQRSIADVQADGRLTGCDIRPRGVQSIARADGSALGAQQRRAGGGAEGDRQRRCELRSRHDGPLRGQQLQPPGAVRQGRECQHGCSEPRGSGDHLIEPKLRPILNHGRRNASTRV